MEPVNSINFIFAPARTEPAPYQAVPPAEELREGPFQVEGAEVSIAAPRAQAAGGPLYPTERQPAAYAPLEVGVATTGPLAFGEPARETLIPQVMIAPVTGDPLATLAQAEEMITLAQSGRPSEAEVRIASDAYLLEMQAQNELMRSQTQGLMWNWEWLA
jgi:hypothetical protein